MMAVTEKRAMMRENFMMIAWEFEIVVGIAKYVMIVISLRYLPRYW
jgi:hypothetical protein